MRVGQRRPARTRARSRSSRAPRARAPGGAASRRRRRVLPCTRKPPNWLTDCGVRPMWPMTGTPDPTTCRMTSSCPSTPSSLTACAPLVTSAPTAVHRGGQPLPEREKRQVRDRRTCRRPSGRRRAVCSGHQVDRGRQRRRVAVDDHRGRVAHQHGIDAATARRCAADQAS